MVDRSPGSRGTLYVVATPIGHLDDITLRALDVLSRSTVIACEDTRVTRGLLARHRIKVRLISCHRFNERRRADEILDLLRRGETASYVTDGGTPAISDPGAILIRRARAEGHRVIPIPGPSAVATLLSVSGCGSTAFTFLGFLPHRKGERRRALEAVRREPRPLLFFESPHRLRASLADAAEVLGDRGAFLGREMTKMHEEYLSGTIGSIREGLAGRRIRGEVAVLVEGAPAGPRRSTAPEIPPEPPEDAVRRLIDAGWDRREALRRIARERGVSRREIYRMLIARKGRRE